MLSTLALWTLGCKLRELSMDWDQDGRLLPGAFDGTPDEEDIRYALFNRAPVEWNRLPHFQVGLRRHRPIARNKSSLLTQIRASLRRM
jgi:hypothetical protein